MGTRTAFSKWYIVSFVAAAAAIFFALLNPHMFLSAVLFAGFFIGNVVLSLLLPKTKGQQKSMQLLRRFLPVLFGIMAAGEFVALGLVTVLVGMSFGVPTTPFSYSPQMQALSPVTGIAAAVCTGLYFVFWFLAANKGAKSTAGRSGR